MEQEIFNLLKEVSKNGNITDVPSTIINAEQRKLDSKKERKFNVLIKHGLISNNGNNVFIITEYGYDVAQHNSWIAYLNHRKVVLENKSKKDKYDLYISWFQSKTGWLPYLVSVVGLVFSIYAYNNSKDKPHNKRTKQEHNKVIHKSIKDIDSSTKNI
jgi:hypothetical protein